MSIYQRQKDIIIKVGTIRWRKEKNETSTTDDKKKENMLGQQEDPFEVSITFPYVIDFHDLIFSWL